MVKKVAFVASVMVHIKSFHIPYLKYFHDNGFETSVIACDDMDLPYCDTKIQVPFERFPIKKNNLKAYRKLRKLFTAERYDIIHCHTPVAAFLTRLAARKSRKNGTKVIYTAHGFHFYKGAPLLNWLLFFPIEWVCSFFTDVLITINKEDFAFAKKRMHAKKIFYIPGVGVNTEKFFNIEAYKSEKRKEIGILENDIGVLSVGELNDNKNHEIVIRALSELKNESVKYIICGEGDKKEYLEAIAKELGFEKQLILLGYRTDIPQICSSCDIFAFPSKREGLPVSVMEAMAAGLPVICSEIRGNTDLIVSGKGGFLCSPLKKDEFARAAADLIGNSDKRKSFGEFNKERVKEFSSENVEKLMREVYMHTG